MPHISEEFLAGAKAAADWAHDNYETTVSTDILDAVIAEYIRAEWGVSE